MLRLLGYKSKAKLQQAATGPGGPTPMMQGPPPPALPPPEGPSFDGIWGS